jgi:hypothetical protein
MQNTLRRRSLQNSREGIRQWLEMRALKAKMKYLELFSN